MPSKLSLGLVALMALGMLSGCHQVTIVSFKVEGMDPPPTIQTLYVDASQKSPVSLGGLNETVGLYDLSPPFTITTTGCLEGKVNLYKMQMYRAITDKITIELQRVEDGGPCPKVTPSGLDYGMGGTGGQTILPGTGGAAGSPDDGGQGGGAGTSGSAGTSGAGGAPGVGGMTGTGGSDGGVDGVGGECDDGGVHDGGGPDLGRCEMPVGDPAPGEIPPFTTASAKCTDYCAQIFGTDGGAILCPDLYANVTQCQRYCTLAGWPDGGGAFDSNDTIDCRNKWLNSARMNPQASATYCVNAGPGGAGTECSGTMGACGKLCNAWSKICGGSQADCMTACADNSAAAACRIPWLVRAAGDSRYCALVSLTAPSCLPPGC